MGANSELSGLFQAATALVSALLLSMAVTSCLVCLKFFRRPFKAKNPKPSRYPDTPTLVDPPNPFTAISLHDDREERHEDVNSYRGLDIVTHLSQVDESILTLTFPDYPMLNYSSLNHVKSCADLQRCDEGSDGGDTRWRNRSHSLASIHLNLEVSQPTILFTVCYVRKRSTFTVVLQEVIHIPERFRGKVIYATVYLYPEHANGLTSRFVVCDDVGKFGETFKFRNVSLDQLEKSTLKMCLLSKKTKKGSKDVFIGQVFVVGSEADLTAEHIDKYNMKLERKQLKRVSTSEKYLCEDLGELLVLLQHQESANRMKVLLRKAHNLPRSDKFLGQPVHGVIINLWKDGEVINQRETTMQRGYNPVWNQPFLFDMPKGDVTSLYLEFVISRGRLYKTNVVGHVTVGSDTCNTGTRHWVDTMNLGDKEIARWHNVMPVFKFK